MRRRAPAESRCPVAALVLAAADRRAGRAGRRRRRLRRLQRRRRRRRRRRHGSGFALYLLLDLLIPHRAARPRARCAGADRARAGVSGSSPACCPRCRLLGRARGPPRGRRRTAPPTASVGSSWPPPRPPTRIPTFAPDQVASQRPPTVHGDPAAWDARRPPGPARPGRPRPAGRMGAAPGRLRPQGLAQPRRADRRADGRVRQSAPNRQRAPPTVSWSRSTPRFGTTSPISTAGTSSGPTASRRSPGFASSGRWDAAVGAGPWSASSRPARARTRLRSEIVATPWADEKAMHDEAMVQAAVAERCPRAPRSPRSPTCSSRATPAAANDLSLADGRFAPDLLEIAARRAVAGWAQAIDGDDGALRAWRRRRQRGELLLRRGHQPDHADGGARTEGEPNPGRRPGRGRRAADDDDRGRSLRSTLHREP